MGLGFDHIESRKIVSGRFTGETRLMEKILQKLAQQLNSLDESSLTSLWETLAAKVEHFEPSKAWEEAVLALSMVQAMRWKNQLFNYYWSQSVKTGAGAPQMRNEDGVLSGYSREPGVDSRPNVGHAPKQGCKVLSFRPVKND